MAAPKNLTPDQRTLRARIAANTRWSRETGRPNALRAQAGLRAKFEREVDPDGTLPEAERRRRADCAYRAHMQRLALKSSKARTSAQGCDGCVTDSVTGNVTGSHQGKQPDCDAVTLVTDTPGSAA